MTADLNSWCTEQAAGFRKLEEWQQPDGWLRADTDERDGSLVSFVLSSLTDPDCAGGGEILALLAMRRQVG